MASGLRQRFVGGVAWSGLAAIFNQGSTFIVNVLLANLLGRAVFGRYAIVQSTLLTVTTLGQLALGYAATKYVAELRVRDPMRAGRVIALCLVLAAVSGTGAGLGLIAFARPLATAVLRAPPVGVLLLIAALGVPCITMSGCAAGILAGLERFRASGVASVIAGLAYLLFGAGGAWLGGIRGCVAGLVVAFVVQAMALLAALVWATKDSGIAVRLTGAWRERATLFRFALPAALGGISYLPSLWLCSAIVARQKDGLSEVAVYSAANSFRVIVLFVPGVVNGVGMSLLNSVRGTGDGRRLRKVFVTNIMAVVGSALLGAVAVVLVGPFALRAYGRAFESGFGTLVVLVGAGVLEAVAMAVYQVIVSSARLWTSAWAISWPRDVVILSLTYLWAPTMGARGMALAYACGNGIALISIIWWSHRIGLVTMAPPPSGGALVAPETPADTG